MRNDSNTGVLTHGRASVRIFRPLYSPTIQPYNWGPHENQTTPSQLGGRGRMCSCKYSLPGLWDNQSRRIARWRNHSDGEGMQAGPQDNWPIQNTMGNRQLWLIQIPRPWGIFPALLKEVGKLLAKRLTFVLSACLGHRYVPRQRSDVKVILISKPDKTDYSDSNPSDR